MDKASATVLIRQEAKRLGFSSVGIARAGHMDDEAKRLEEWLGNGKHGEMSYMERYFDLRTDPRKLVPGARSVVSLMYNYYSDTRQEDPSAPRFSTYAYGRDYHKVLRKKLKTLLRVLRDQLGDFTGRCFVDSGPVLERDWAVRAGNGWMGKNTMLISPKMGSYFFLAELIVDLDLEYDHPIRDHCGTCTRCIDACPTEAIDSSGYVIDGSRCISYLTIELKNDIPSAFEGKMETWAFGCDICQQVCPWNRFSIQHREPEFEPRAEFLAMKKEDWYEITEDVFDEIFEGSAVKRTGYAGLMRNLAFINSAD